MDSNQRGYVSLLGAKTISGVMAAELLQTKRDVDGLDVW